MAGSVCCALPWVRIFSLFSWQVLIFEVSPHQRDKATWFQEETPHRTTQEDGWILESHGVFGVYCDGVSFSYGKPLV